MSERLHTYRLEIEWTGNLGTGTSGYRDYSRSHLVRAAGKPDIAGSSDPNFRGDPARWTPEELLLASLSTCHKLWVLHLCAASGVVITAYTDQAEAEMREDADGGGQFVSTTLRPEVVISADSDLDAAHRAHEQAHALCFIARSVNFPVRVEPQISRR